MAEHFDQICPKHGPKRQEEYDDHYIFVCDKCIEENYKEKAQ